MGAPGYFVATGLFMISAALFFGQAMGSRPNSDSAVVSFVVAIVCVAATLALGIAGIAAAAREKSKDRP